MQQRKGYGRMAKTYIIIPEKSYKINYKFHMKSIYYILECSILWFKTSWNRSVQCIRSSSPKCHLNYNFMNIKKCNKDELDKKKKAKANMRDTKASVSSRTKIWINYFHLLLEYELKKSLASSMHKYEKDYYCVQWTLAHTYIETLKGKVGHTVIIKTHWLVQENILLPFKLLFLQLQNSFIKRDNTYVIICHCGSACVVLHC